MRDAQGVPRSESRGSSPPVEGPIKNRQQPFRRSMSHLAPCSTPLRSDPYFFSPPPFSPRRQFNQVHWLTQHPVPLTAPPVLPPSRLCPPQSISMPGTLCGGLGSRAQILLYLSGQLCCASQFSDKACQYRRQQKQGRSNFLFLQLNVLIF